MCQRKKGHYAQDSVERSEAEFARLSQQYRDPVNRERAFRCAQIALGTVRHFEGHVSDSTAWIEIHERADELEGLLNLIEKSD